MSALPVIAAQPAGRWLTLAARLAVAAVFVWAAVPKLLDPAAFAEDIGNYRLLPEMLVGPLAAVLPVLELVVAVALVAGVEAKGAALVAGAMLLGFTAAMGQAMARGIDIDCGCFGSASTTEVGWGPILRNSALLVACAWVVIAPEVPWRRPGETVSPPDSA